MASLIQMVNGVMQSYEGTGEQVIFLRSSEFEVRTKDQGGGYTALRHVARITNNHDLIHLLLKTPHCLGFLNAREGYGNTSLMIAALNNNPRVIEALLTYEEQIDVTGKDDTTFILRGWGRMTKYVRLLECGTALYVNVLRSSYYCE